MKTEADLICFETRIRDHWRSGALPSLTHLCGGNEWWMINRFQLWYNPGTDWVFSTHRNHYHALIAGIPEAKLEQDILAGHSMFTFSRERRFFSSSILAGNCSIAAGVAYALKEAGQPGCVWCFLGDGAEEEGNFYEAAVFVEANALPCVFVIEDNGRQVDTEKEQRRPHPVAGLDKLLGCVTRYKYVATYPHAGDGSKAGTITFQPAAITRMRGLK